MRTILDFETSTHNKGHPFDPRNFAVSYSVKFNDVVHFRYYSDPDFRSFLADVIARTTRLVGYAIKFDVHWLGNLGINLPPEAEVWDCQLAEFILSGQQNGFISLNETLESYGLPAKKDIVAEYWAQGISTEDIPPGIVEEYNRWDVETTDMVYGVQQAILPPKQYNLVLLEGADLLTLVAAERNGFKWDREAADRYAAEHDAALVEIERGLARFLPPDIPGPPGFNFDSGDQLSAFLYGGSINYEYATPETSVYKSGPKKGEEYTRNRWSSVTVQFPKRFKPLEGTEVSKTLENGPEEQHFYQVDDPTLKQLTSRRKEDKDLLAALSARSKKIKVVEMIKSINKKIDEKNWQDGCIHPQYNQNIVITGRLSSSAPNLQNTPPEVDKFLVSRYV